MRRPPIPITGHHLPFWSARRPSRSSKISGGTRSLDGRDCRDAFLGLMRTAAKLGIAFWDYLGDRLRIPGQPIVPYLPDLVRCRGQPA